MRFINFVIFIFSRVRCLWNGQISMHMWLSLHIYFPAVSLGRSLTELPRGVKVNALSKGTLFFIFIFFIIIINMYWIFFSTKSPRLQTSSLTLQALLQQISTCCTPHTLITEVSFRLCNSCSSSSQAQRNRSVRIPREGRRFFGMLLFDSCPEISAEKFGNLIEYLRWRGVKGQKKKVKFIL